MQTSTDMDKVSDIFVQDLSFFGYRAPAIAWIALAGSVIGVAFSVAYIGGLSNARKG